MPYITEYKRVNIEEKVLDLVDVLNIQGKETGDVVYSIYLLMLHLYSVGNFTERSEAIKALECAKIEYYRRVMSPYEDQKIKENGDIV